MNAWPMIGVWWECLLSLGRRDARLQSPAIPAVSMKILICNDDGYQAPGIQALYEALRTVADVEVVALAPLLMPETTRSGR